MSTNTTNTTNTTVTNTTKALRAFETARPVAVSFVERETELSCYANNYARGRWMVVLVGWVDEEAACKAAGLSPANVRSLDAEESERLCDCCPPRLWRVREFDYVRVWGSTPARARKRAKALRAYCPELCSIEEQRGVEFAAQCRRMEAEARYRAL